VTVINYLVHLLKQTLSGLDLVPLLKQTISGLDGNVGVLPAVIHTIRVNINHLSLNLLFYLVKTLSWQPSFTNI
jgi:hypothetical protein